MKLSGQVCVCVYVSVYVLQTYIYACTTFAPVHILAYSLNLCLKHLHTYIFMCVCIITVIHYQ